MALNGKKEYIGILKRYDSNTVEIEEQELIRNRQKKYINNEEVL